MIGMQITATKEYVDELLTIADAEWDSEPGFVYVYLIDLKNMKYTLEYVEPLY